MSISYSKNDTADNIAVGNKYTIGRFGDTYDLTRGFTKFDLSFWGLILASIVSVTWNIKVLSVYGSQTYKLRSSGSSGGWGSTLDATQTDFESTSSNVESSQIISSTGWKSFSVNKNNLDLSGFNYFRLAGLNENTTTTTNLTFASQNNATTENRPYLEITLASGETIKYVPHAGI